MKAIRILLAIVASVAALVVLAILALVDPNDYKSYVTTWVEERTGRPFAIEGDLELAFFPWLAIESENAALGHPPGFDVAEPFAAVERISAAVKLLPLLERRFEIGKVRIDGLQVNLARDAGGRGNWQDFDAASESESQGETRTAALVDRLDIESVEIRNGEVRWYEDGPQPRYVATGIRLATGRIRAGEPIDVSLAVHIEDTASRRRFDVETRSLVGLAALRAVGRDRPGRDAAGDDAAGRGAAGDDTAGRGAAGDAPGGDAAGGIVRNEATDDTAIELRDFTLRLQAYDPMQREIASGSLEAERLSAAPDGRIEIGAAHVDARLAEAPAVPQGLDLGADWTAVRFDPRAGAFAVDGLATRVAGITAEWQLAAQNLIDAPRIEGALRITDAPLGAALGTFGVAIPASVDPGTLANVDASTAFRIGMSLTGPESADSADETPSASPRLGPYRLDVLQLEALSLEALGTVLRGDASLGDAGVLRATFDVPDHAPSDALLALAAAHAPDALDLTALERLALSGSVELGLVDRRIAVQDFRAALLGAELVAALDAPRVANGSSRVLRGTVRTTPIDPEHLSRLLGTLMPAAIAPEELGAVTVDTRFEYDTAAQRLALDDVSLEAFGLSATGHALVTGLGETLATSGEPGAATSIEAPAAASGGAVAGASETRIAASGEARVAAFSPRALMQRFGQPVPETSDPGVLQRAALTASFEADADGGRFRNIDLALDDSRITGEYAIDGLANPAHEFTLAIDRVDVDRYLPPQADDLPDDADDDARTAGDIELPAEALRNLRIDGHVNVGDLRLAGLAFNDVATQIAVGDGRARLDSARASLYGGEFAGSFEVDTTDRPALRLTGRASSLALGPLITALTGDANVSGTGDFDLDLMGNGATVLENVETANGRVTFSMRDGAIEGFNLGRTLCAVYNTARRLPAPADRPRRTEYVSIGGTATVTDGIATSPDLLARTSFLDLTGSGHLALAEQRLDYTLEAKLTGTTGIPGCEAMDQLIGESLPLTLQGTVTDPAIRPDFSEIIQRRLRDAVRDRLQDRLLDLLR